MPRHTLKLIALVMVFSIPPALAGQAVSNAPTRHWDCAKRHAAAAASQEQQPKGATVMTLSDRVPLGGSLFDLGRRELIAP
ncbi:MAG: hypothetical protein ACTHJK_14630 [Sphingomicrobium sp.]